MTSTNNFEITNTIYATEYNSLIKSHQLFLMKYGVSMPGPGTKHALMLCILYKNIGKLISLKDLSDLVHLSMPSGSRDVQPRHLKYSGWDISLSGKSDNLLKSDQNLVINGKAIALKVGNKVPNGYVILNSVNNHSSDFNPDKRRGAINRTDWSSICESYDNKCAVCNTKKKVEKGHKDPSQGQDSKNIIPMCSDCNNWASDKFIFDDNGRVVALNSPAIVKDSSISVQIKIFSELIKEPHIKKLIKLK